MAQRRMFSIKVIDSARFLKMPSSSRLLYFDLCMRADDDGVVEGFNVLRMTGATEDDLRILVAKDFVKVLNEDLVTYVTDWKEHNKIRADRKVDSIYKDLLLSVFPDAKLLESKERADRKKSGTSQGQLKDGIGKDRLGKDRLGQDSTDKDNVEEKNINLLSLWEQLGFGTVNQVIYSDLEILEKELAEMNAKKSLLKSQWELEKRDITRVKQLKEEAEKVKLEMEQAERNYDLSRLSELKYGKLAGIEKEIQEQQEKLDATYGNSGLLKQEVTADEIADIVSKWTGIPVSKLAETEKEKILNLENSLKNRVIR